MAEAELGEASYRVVAEHSVPAEDLMRAQVYRLLARFLSAPAEQADIDVAAALEGGDTRLGRAISAFAAAAAATDKATLAEEFHDFFIGLGRGELVPYGSYYLTGFLQEKPLAKLRQDMARLGIERDPDVRDPEDHIAALAEMMAGLIDGTYGKPLPVAEQKVFFERHIDCWAPYFFRDLEGVKSPFYSALGRVGSEFIAIEENSFALI
jgi:TorA maturation chaperone TorD